VVFELDSAAVVVVVVVVVEDTVVFWLDFAVVTAELLELEMQ
jgi:hypothetical protein